MAYINTRKISILVNISSVKNKNMYSAIYAKTTEISYSRCRGTATLVVLLNDVHEKDVEMKTTTFADMDEFMCWKEQIEKDTSSWFARHRQNSDIIQRPITTAIGQER
eukprot:gene1636-1814_t